MKWCIVCIITLSIISEIADKTLHNILLRCIRLHSHDIQNFDYGFAQRQIYMTDYIS